MNEKRGSIRYAANATVSFKAEGDDPKVMQGQLLNISYSGCAVTLKENIAADTMIQFDIAADFSREHLTGKGKVVHVGQQKTFTGGFFKIGIKFIEYDQNAVLRFISESQRRMLQEERRKVEEQRKRGQLGSTDFGPY